MRTTPKTPTPEQSLGVFIERRHFCRLAPHKEITARHYACATRKGGGEPSGELADAIKESFGSFAGMKGQLTEAAINVQGSGWGAMAWEPLRKMLVVEQVYDHQGNIGNGTVPLLVLDMWEHAYYLQYQNVKGDWVKAFWKLVNWEDVTHRLDAVRPLDLAL
jgi:Fe-Mn family superoxide dismutase